MSGRVRRGNPDGRPGRTRTSLYRDVRLSGPAGAPDIANSVRHPPGYYEKEGASERASQPGFDPWAIGIDPAERVAATRELRALALLLFGPDHPITLALAAAITDPAALDRAAAELYRLPALSRRRLLATYAALMRPTRTR
jgi:hypothetical protein